MNERKRGTSFLEYALLAALVGIVGARLGFAFMDPLAAGIISLLIIKVAFEVAKDAVDNMLDTSVDDEIEEDLRKAYDAGKKMAEKIISQQ